MIFNSIISGQDFTVLRGEILLLPPPKNAMFLVVLVGLFVLLSVRQQDYLQSNERISI